jgi:hypothetical protein
MKQRGSSRLPRDLPRKFWNPVMGAARALFGKRNHYGVVAFGIGPRIRRGRPSEEHALNVYVIRKEEKPRLEVPELSFSVGRSTWTVMPNVIATGKRPRASLGGAPRYSGVHPGATITMRGTTPGRGALGCILSRGNGPTHALTAGHLFTSGSIGSSVFAATSPAAPVRAIGTLVANYLDSSEADAALIELNPTGVAMVNTNGPRLSDFIGFDGSFLKLVRAFLATGNDFSREVSTGDGPMDALLSAPTRGTFLSRNTIPTDGEITNSGDSGTILCTGASNQFAVGLCSGALGAHSVFVPFSRALELAGNTVGRLEIF